MAQNKAERLAAIHEESLREFDEIQTAYRDERIQCLQDRRFYSVPGAQWEGPLLDLFENKPRFEFNKVHLSVIRIINEYRNNRITVDFTPKDGEEDEMADVCDGLYRADEQASSANEAYDNAFEEAAGGGIGAWRLRAAYEDEDDPENEKQRIRIEPIYDADSCVFFDLNAKRQDKADAKRCYVLTPYDRKSYVEEWGDDPASWPKIIQQQFFDWCTPDMVWVAEVYRVEERNETINVFAGLTDDVEEVRHTDAELRDDPSILETLTATGYRLVRQKKTKRKVVHKYIMSGGKVLEDCGIIPGSCIPIIVTYGKRWVVDGVERCMGHVRLAKDAQRLTNMLMSWLAEMAARFDVEKPILTPEQVAGHAQMWADDNIKKYPYLLLNATIDPQTGAPIPGSQAPQAYTKAPNLPPAMAALAQMAEAALQDLLGNQQAGEEVQPNISGKAIELIQAKLDMQVFIYLSNFAKAMKRSGEVWLSMMKDICVEPSRKMKTVGADGSSASVVVNQPYSDEEGDRVKNDLGKASYEVNVDVGPSSDSKRAATVRALTGMMTMTQDQELASVLGDLALMNMEGEGLSDIRQWTRDRLLRKGVLKPTEEEQQEMAMEAQGIQPTPDQQYLLAEAEKAQADAAKSRAQTVESVAAANLKQAQTQKTLVEAGVEAAQFPLIQDTAELEQVFAPVGSQAT